MAPGLEPPAYVDETNLDQDRGGPVMDAIPPPPKEVLSAALAIAHGIEDTKRRA